MTSPAAPLKPAWSAWNQMSPTEEIGNPAASAATVPPMANQSAAAQTDLRHCPHLPLDFSTTILPGRTPPSAPAPPDRETGSAGVPHAARPQLQEPSGDRD